MEDRLTPGLYLELGDLDPGDYQRSRVTELLARPGVDRVSWWRNLVPGRTDLPNAFAGGTLLGVAETSTDFVAPAPLAGSQAHHFGRTPRPGQGILTGRPTTGLLLVWISPREPADGQRLRDWADFVHIRLIAAAAVPGYTMITPYQNLAGTDPLFLHLYEMDSDDPEATYQLMAEQLRVRLGGYRSPQFKEWADLAGAGGVIVYVNTFGLLGSSEPGVV